MIINGGWKTGKTDFSLYIAEKLLECGMIKHVGSNIKSEDPRIKFIDSLTYFEYWIHTDRKKKLYIFDEAIESTTKRRAMSQINVKWLETIPQLSKGYCHLLVVCQDDSLIESTFKNPVFFFGAFTKIRKKSVIFRSQKLFRNKIYGFRNVPATSIDFDPDRPATFKLTSPNMQSISMIPPIEACYLYAMQNQNMLDIAYHFKKKQSTEARRLIKRGLRILLTYLQNTSEGVSLEQFSKKID